ncbi:MAG: DUF4838 domain-containing protein [Planctomycetota bacterium]
MRTRMTFHLVVACGIVLGGVGCTVADVPIAADGEPQAVIVHNGHEKQAGELQAYLKKITGAELPLSATGEAAPEGLAAVELRVVDKLPGASDKRTGDHAYRLRTRDGSLRLTAQSALGLDYAVYGLLQDHLGVGFYSETYEYIPDRPGLTVGELNELSEPAFYGRGMNLWAERKRMADWSRKNRQYPPGGKAIVSGHNFQRYGTRDHCPLDEDFQRAFGEKLKEQFAKRDADAPPMPVGQMDGPFRPGCGKCENCKKVLEREGADAALMHLMLSGAMDHAGQEYPDHEIITFAYNNTHKVPKTVRPHENVWVNVVSSGGDHLNPVRGNPAMRGYAQALKGWPQAAPGRVTTWHWAKNYHAQHYEWPNMVAVVDAIRLWDECGINGAYMQEDRADHNWHELKHWVWAQLIWDPQQDAAALMDRFFGEYYGPKAAPLLREYFQTADAIRREKDVAVSVVRGGSFGKNLRKTLLTPDVLARLDAILARALQAAEEEDNPVFARHVAEARAYATDEPIIDTLRVAEGFGRVTDPRDGSEWYVAGGREDVPARIDRYTARMRDPRYRLWMHAKGGGRLYELKSEQLTAAVIPEMDGRIIGLVHGPTDRHILAGEGYRDAPKIRQSLWTVTHADETSIDTDMKFSQEYWGWIELGHMTRHVAVGGDEPGLTVQRRYRVRRRWRKHVLPGEINAHWGLKVPDAGTARVRIRGGGIDETLEGEALRDAATERKLTADDGPLVVELDRGDGLTVRLETPAEGWKKLEVRPVNLSEPSKVAPRRERRRSWWPGDRDIWPVDQTPRVVVVLTSDVAPEITKEPVDLPRQRLTVHANED